MDKCDKILGTVSRTQFFMYLPEESMEQANTIDKLNQALAEMGEIAHRELLLFSAEGEWIAGRKPDEDFAEEIRLFVDSPQQSQTRKDWGYLRIELEAGTEYVLLCNVGENREESFVLGSMAQCAIRNLFLAIQEGESVSSVLREILNGEITGATGTEKCARIGLKPCESLLYVIQSGEEKDEIFVETLRNLFADGTSDHVVEMDAFRTVLIKAVADMGDTDFEAYARMIADNLQTEAMVNVWVGYGDPVDSFEQMGTAYRDACTALKIGMVFYVEDQVFYYQKLGIGRLIYKLPADLCEMFLWELLGENMELDLDEETMTTIKKLFENNLNISETARQLYIHRNTLVYRLERIEKKLELDIRTFEDAMLFRIALLVRVHLNALKEENTL